MALRLARWSGSMVQFWMNMQSFHDARAAERKSAARIKREVTPLEAAAAA